jgi:hypothetical protein
MELPTDPLEADAARLSVVVNIAEVTRDVDALVR